MREEKGLRERERLKSCLSHRLTAGWSPHEMIVIVSFRKFKIPTSEMCPGNGFPKWFNHLTIISVGAYDALTLLLESAVPNTFSL